MLLLFSINNLVKGDQIWFRKNLIRHINKNIGSIWNKKWMQRCSHLVCLWKQCLHWTWRKNGEGEIEAEGRDSLARIILAFPLFFITPIKQHLMTGQALELVAGCAWWPFFFWSDLTVLLEQRARLCAPSPLLGLGWLVMSSLNN